MKKLYFLLPALMILCFSGYTQISGFEKVKNPILIKKILTPRDSIVIDLNTIMNSCTGLRNNSETWATVKEKIYNLLLFKWKYGVLRGLKIEEAFFVNVGQQTMTQNDINQKKLIVIVGIALIRPSEFEIIKLEKQL